jgi:HKD family nuclease
MKAKIDFIFLPYSGKVQKTLVDVLIKELLSPKWSQFMSAVAFARQSGNYPKLLNALHTFVKTGATVEMTFGANIFSKEFGSDYEAIETIIDEISDYPNVKIYLYSEPDRVFHPKIYLFRNDKAALLIIGSSNWTKGGLETNVEANALIYLDLHNPEHKIVCERVIDIFRTYWQEIKK